MKKSNQEIMEVEVEEVLPEMELEKTIDTQLAKANVTEQVIAALKEKYGNMVLKSLDDKESYLELKSSKREVAKVRIIAEKITKRGRESAIKIQRLWLAKEKEVVGKIDEVESHLASEIKKFDDEVERKENEAKQKREEAFIAKQSQLLKYGAEYKNGSYELGHISYELELIKQADDDMWNDTILPKYRKVFEEKEIERVAEEDRKKEEAAKLKAEQDKLIEQQRLLKEQQAEFERQMKELQDAKDAADREARLVQQKKDDEERERVSKIFEERTAKLQSIGLKFERVLGVVYEEYNPENKFSLQTLTDDEKFNDIVSRWTPVFEQKKKEEEAKRLAKIEEDKQAAIAKALEDQKASEQKRQKDLEEQKQQEIIRKQLELETANDRTKYQDVVDYLLKTPIHVMKSPTYRSKMNIISDFIDGLKN